MDIELIKKLIKKHMPRHGDVISQMMVSERYYMVDNDINYLKEKPKS